MEITSFEEKKTRPSDTSKEIIEVEAEFEIGKSSDGKVSGERIDRAARKTQDWIASAFSALGNPGLAEVDISPVDPCVHHSVFSVVSSAEAIKLDDIRSVFGCSNRGQIKIRVKRYIPGM